MLACSSRASRFLSPFLSPRRLLAVRLGLLAVGFFAFCAPFELRTHRNRRRRALHPPRSTSQQRHRAHAHTQPPEWKPANEPRRRPNHAEAKTRVRDNAHLSRRPHYRNGCAILQLLRGRQAISQANRHPDHFIDTTKMVGHGFAASARPPTPEARRENACTIFAAGPER